ncbi:hypothetical protein ACJIZ3_003681 [Penstemon smallii]|uniref:Transposase Tnp1/En/Spm-like domain-containing protein n=1 Tax=Penstemon smallii TaxID=265156 RepID=A0ABD3UCM7_9LAMI
MGERVGGRANLFGFGVSQNDVWGDAPTRRPNYRIISEYEKNMAKMQNELLEMKAKMASMEQMRNASTPTEVPRAESSTSNHCSSTNASTQILRVGARVSIRSLFDSSRIVATGRVYGLDPSLKVGSQLLGPNWCEVHIHVAIECGEKLPRPYALFKTIKHAEGATVAWPCHLTYFESFAIYLE